MKSYESYESDNESGKVFNSEDVSKLLDYRLEVPGESRKENFFRNNVTFVTSVTAQPANHAGRVSEAVQPQEPASLDAERGYLTVGDMPELQRRLELSGWKAERRGNQLVCWSFVHRKPRIQ